MTLLAFETLAFSTNLTVYLPSLFNLLLLEDVFAVVASYVLIFVSLEVFADFKVAHFVELFLRKQIFDITDV